jgi:hypothetical protein
VGTFRFKIDVRYYSHRAYVGPRSYGCAVACCSLCRLVVHFVFCKLEISAQWLTHITLPGPHWHCQWQVHRRRVARHSLVRSVILTECGLRRTSLRPEAAVLVPGRVTGRPRRPAGAALVAVPCSAQWLASGLRLRRLRAGLPANAGCPGRLGPPARSSLARRRPRPWGAPSPCHGGPRGPRLGLTCQWATGTAQADLYPRAGTGSFAELSGNPPLESTLYR